MSAQTLDLQNRAVEISLCLVEETLEKSGKKQPYHYDLHFVEHLEWKEHKNFPLWIDSPGLIHYNIELPHQPRYECDLSTFIYYLFLERFLFWLGFLLWLLVVLFLSRCSSYGLLRPWCCTLSTPITLSWQSSCCLFRKNMMIHGTWICDPGSNIRSIPRQWCILSECRKSQRWYAS